MQQERIERAAALLRNAHHVVALTGAGISKPSGIPDFRSPGGLWEEDDPMEVASIQTLRTNPQRFFNWLRGLMETMLPAQPNPAHLALAELEAAGILHGVVTQNIDSLHQKAGSQQVYELHGNVRTATCMQTGQCFPVDDQMIADIRQGRVPHSTHGGMLKPDVVLFGEMLPEAVFAGAIRAIEVCDAMIIAGTSLEVQPAASLPLAAVQRGVPIIIITMTDTYLDGRADVLLREDVAVALPAIVKQIQG